MAITNSKLSGAAGIAAALSGLLYITIQFIHPADEVASLTTQAWATVHVLSFSMAVLAMVGLTGFYLRQSRQFGLLGLLGYVLFGLFFVLQAAFNFAETLIAPLLAAHSPQLAEDIVGLFGRTPAVTDLGPLAYVPLVAVALYVGGAVLFGIAIVRARVLSRGAGILMIAAATVTPIAGALLPHALERLAAIPMGLALIWLGYSLWADSPRTAPEATPLSAASTPARAAAE
jgi:hypothetical protein